jgi:hypothetical protein
MGKSNRTRPARATQRFQHEKITTPQISVLTRLFITAGILDADVRCPEKEAATIVRDERDEGETQLDSWAQVSAEAVCLVSFYNVDPLCKALSVAVENLDAKQPPICEVMTRTLHQLSFDFSVLCNAVCEPKVRQVRASSPPPPSRDVIRDTVNLMLRLEEFLARFGTLYPLAGVITGVTLQEEESSATEEDDSDEESDGEDLESEARSDDTETGSDSDLDADTKFY